MIIPSTEASRDRAQRNVKVAAKQRLVHRGPEQIRPAVVGNVGMANVDLPAFNAFKDPAAGVGTQVRFFTEGSTRARVRLKQQQEFPDVDFEPPPQNVLSTAWEFYFGDDK
jgi:hypothetical protein